MLCDPRPPGNGYYVFSDLTPASLLPSLEIILPGATKDGVGPSEGIYVSGGAQHVVEGEEV